MNYDHYTYEEKKKKGPKQVIQDSGIVKNVKTLANLIQKKKKKTTTKNKNKQKTNQQQQRPSQPLGFATVCNFVAWSYTYLDPEVLSLRENYMVDMLRDRRNLYGRREL